jgi:hypothetical protein
LSAVLPLQTDPDVDDDQEGTKNDKDRADDVIKDCRELISFVIETDGDNRTEAVDDLEFLAGDQWPDDIERLRELDKRPCLTINTLPTYVRQVTNDQRQNKGAIKVHPVDDAADVETADVIQGLIRHIEYDSNAEVAYDTAVTSAASNGFGWFRLVTEYCDELSDEQDIKFRRIRNPLTVYPGYHEQPDGSDLKKLAISIKLKKEDFKRQYPDADMAGFDALVGVGDYSEWIDDQFIRVAEFYRIEQESVEVVLLSNGERGFKDKLLELPEGVTIVKTRKGTRSKVRWFKLTAVEILEEAEIKCKWIPVFPVYGDELDIEGVVIRSGLIRHAKDSVRMNNFWMTSATEEVALRNKTPYIGAEGQFEGYEDDWGSANNRNFAYLTYKPVTLESALAPPPQRQPMADVPTGTLAMAMHAADNIQRTIGIFNAGIGQKSNETSGKAILARQREGDVGTYHYTDNLNISRKHAGRCIISMLPFYYDTERAVRILGEDDTATQTTLNQPNTTNKKSKDGKVREVLNNVKAGKYDVTVTSGPSYTTQRTEAGEYLTNIAQSAKDPATSQVVTYLAIKNSDAPGADEAAKMLKKLLPQQVVEAEPGQDGEEMIQTPKGPIPASQAGAAIAGMDQALTQAEQAVQQLQATDIENKKRELDIKAQETAMKATEAETARLQAEKALEDDAFDAREREIKLLEETALARVEAAKADARAEAATANAERATSALDTVGATRESAQHAQPVNVIDSSVAGPLQAVAEGLAQIGQAVQSQSQAIAAMALAEKDEPESKTISITTPSGQVYQGTVR